MREKPTWKDMIVSLKKEKVYSHPACTAKSRARERERERERERARGRERERERERKESLREGKVQEKKVEKENGECTCNLTVMKGTPRKECNKTKVKWVRFGERGGGAEKKRKRKKRKKILNFQPAAWERSVFLPVSQTPWNEKAKQTCSPRLYLVNHQHYKPVLQALWGRKEGEREGVKKD